MIELKWRASWTASALYSASAVARGWAAADARLAGVLAGPVRELVETVQAAGIPFEGFWREAVPLAAENGNAREQVRQIVVRVKERPVEESVAARLTACVATVQEAMLAALPDGEAQLALRSGPLRELWEGRGPGLLAAIRRATDRAILVERAEVLVVQPIAGGGGEAYLPHTVVSIEAVLANPFAELPEVVRLGWLLAQLRLHQSQYCAPIPPHRLPRLAAVAMVPPALAAAEYVELARHDRATTARALTAWHLVDPTQQDRTERLVDILDSWWAEFCAARGPWDAALAALDRRLVT